MLQWRCTIKLTGNTVLITGGTSGIGLEFAAQLTALGNTVIVTGRTRASVDAALRAVPRIHAYQSDVASLTDIVDLYGQILTDFPGLNVLINNAGIMRRIDLKTAQAHLEDVTREVETNLNGTIRMVSQFLPLLMKQKRAAIVDVSSGLAFVPLAIAPVYCGTKAAIHSFSQSLRVQLKHTNVSVFELAPPRTATSLYDKDFSAQEVDIIKAMGVRTLVKQVINAIESDKHDIRPGLSAGLSIFSRIAPNFSVRMLNRRFEESE